MLHRILFSCVFALVSAVALALPFQITVKSGTSLPTTIETEQTATAYYTIKNATTSQRNRNYMKWLPPNVTQVTHGGTYADTCTALFNLAAHGSPNDSCTLQLNISGAVHAEDPNPEHHLFACFPGGVTCAGTINPLDVSIIPTPAARYIYITVSQASASVYVCPIDATTGLFSFTACQNADPRDSLQNVYPQGIVINNANTTAFISNGALSANVYQCPINPANGVFSTGCTTTPITNPSGYVSYYSFLGLNADGTYAFLPDYNTGHFRMLSCPIFDGRIQNNCASSSTIDGSGNVYGSGIVFNKQNTTGYASLFVNDSVAVCPVTNNTWTSCTIIDGATVGGSVESLYQPGGIALNHDNTKLYIATRSNRVYACDPNAISSTNFTSCFTATQMTNGEFPWGIALNAQNTFAYFTDYDSHVYICPIQQDGSFPFNTCTSIGGFSTPTDVALLY